MSSRRSTASIERPPRLPSAALLVEAAPGRAPETLARWRRLAGAGAPGFALCLAVAAAATALSHIVPLGSGPVLAIVLGVALGSIVGPRDSLRPGISMSSSGLLRGAVIVLGAELPLGAVASQGARSLPVIVLTLGGCLIVARTVGGRLGIRRTLRTLIGVGTGICGASAIAAVTPVIEAEELDVGYAVATIFLFNVLAVLIFPPVGRALGLSPQAFGVFAGTAVNDLSSVVAAASVYGGALHTAVIVKLARTLMIVPICVVLAGSRDRDRAAAPDRGSAATRVALALGKVPRFLLGFLALAALCTSGVVPHSLTPAIGETATLMITVALAAVGLSIDLRALQRTGARPIALGGVLWITVSMLSLAAQELLPRAL